MIAHVVVFWLKSELSDSERAEFRSLLEALSDIPSVTKVHVGTPAATPQRPVIDTSYDFMLTVLLEDMAAHDSYQAHARHHQFLEFAKPRWEKVCIYDAD